jgi:predicted nucleotidyltransferase
MHDPNYQLLVSAARLLELVLDELVFVGGCITGLMITDEGAAGVRATIDVDAIAEITSYAEYDTFSERLRAVGFREDTDEDAPLCRWKHGEITLDVMPLDEKILGFSNRWYGAAMQVADRFPLEPSLQIRVVTPPYFVATKLEAFKGRGRGDYFSSHDLEDLISVVDGRPALLDEIRRAPEDLKAYIAAEMKTLVQDSRFIDALPGHLLPDAISQARVGILLQRLEDLSVNLKR